MCAKLNYENTHRNWIITIFTYNTRFSRTKKYQEWNNDQNGLLLDYLKAHLYDTRCKSNFRTRSTTSIDQVMSLLGEDLLGTERGKFRKNFYIFFHFSVAVQCFFPFPSHRFFAHRPNTVKADAESELTRIWKFNWNKFFVQWLD